MSKVFIDSITRLCVADHGGDPAIIAQWTANKTPESLMGWLANPDSDVLVAEDGGAVVAIGGFSGSEIQLNYVAPASRFKGVSKTLLAHMESLMRDRGVRKATLTSTETAHRFYRAAGWQDDGTPQEVFGMANVHPMSKTLA